MNAIVQRVEIGKRNLKRFALDAEKQEYLDALKQNPIHADARDWQWYVACTTRMPISPSRPCNEEMAMLELKELGVNAFLPYGTERGRSNGRRGPMVNTSYKLFPGYVFIGWSPAKPLGAALHAKHIECLLGERNEMVGLLPTPVLKSNMVKLFDGIERGAFANHLKPQKGQMWEVLSGHMQNKVLEVKGMKGANHVELFAEFLGCTRVVNISVDSLRRHA